MLAVRTLLQTSLTLLLSFWLGLMPLIAQAADPCTHQQASSATRDHGAAMDMPMMDTPQLSHHAHQHDREHSASTAADRCHCGLGCDMLGCVGAGTFHSHAVLARFDADPLADLRRQYLRYGLDAAREWWPWGAGASAFPAAYAPHEPISAMVSTFALHAHDDLLEVAIEAGLPGLLLIAALLCIVCAGMRNIALASPRRRPR